MATKKNRQQAWVLLAEAIEDNVPHFYSVVGNQDDFISLYIKVRPDGSCLAVLKQYGSDGGPLVCFGTGYGVAGCIVALDASIQGGNWKVDKPWNPSEK